MALNTIKLKKTGDVRLSLSGVYETRTERYRAWGTGADAATFKATQAIGATGSNAGAVKIPELGDPHDDAPLLTAADIDGSYIDDSHTAAEYVVTFKAPSGSFAWPSTELLRLRRRNVSEFQRVFVGLDGLQIGSPYFEDIIDEAGQPARPSDPNDPAWVDPDAEVGAMVRVTKQLLDVQIMLPVVYNTLWDTMQNFVNEGTFYTAPEGQVQYIGCDTEQQADPITGAINLFTGVLHFVRGALRVYFAGTPIDVGMHERLNIFWKKRVYDDGRTAREPSRWEKAPVHPLGNLSLLIPTASAVAPQVRQPVIT